MPFQRAGREPGKIRKRIYTEDAENTEGTEKKEWKKETGRNACPTRD
jgi:hypothetical protein